MTETTEFELVFEGVSDRWKQEATQAEFAIVCSPYISSPLAGQITSKLSGIKTDIYTSCQFENFLNKSSSIGSLVALARQGHRIYSLNKLNAKITIFSDNFATLGSQNITMRGMDNLEGNIIITNPEMVAQLRQQIDRWAKDAVLMSLKDLEEILALIKPLTHKYKNILKRAKAREKQYNTTKNKPLTHPGIKNQHQISVAEIMASTVVVNSEKGSQPSHLMTKLQALKQEKTMLNSDEITFGMATQFVRNCVWWYAHPKAKRPVKAPGHADRIEQSMYHGWKLEFGANEFLISKAIIRTRNEIIRFIDNYGTDQEFSMSTLIKCLERHVSGCVANYDDEEYGAFYPLTGKHMVLSVHSINVEEAAHFMVHACGLQSALKDKH